MKTRPFPKKQGRTFWLGLGLTAAALGVAAAKRRRTTRVTQWEKRMEAQTPRMALVTGASSGIGEAFARKLASRGYDMVLVARREERLKRLAAECQQRFGVKAEVLVADLSTLEGIEQVEHRIAELGTIDFLVNNAGYSVLGRFAEIPIEEHLGMINCHTLASVRLSRAALSGMVARGRGVIVNVSSIGAFVPKPEDVTYCASKAYLLSFSRALQTELADTDIRVQALCPGFTLTEFHDAPQYAQYQVKARIPRMFWMTPDRVVEESLTALGQGQDICIPGFQNRMIVAAARSGLTTFLLKVLASFFPRRRVIAMKRDTLELLSCPTCHSDLVLQDAAASGDVESGTLFCSHCDKEYPIMEGIPRFIRYEELTGLNRRFARLYDWFSYVYIPFSRIAGALLGGEERARREILDRLEPNGGRVLEVSIGPGVNLPYLVGAPGVGEVYGLDISLGQLKRCRSFSRKNGWVVDLFLGNAEQLPFKDESFESVFHIGGINFFSDKQKAIEEMIRVAKPGAKIVIADETEKGARGYELTLPGFARSFEQGREAVTAPVDLVPLEMEEIHLDMDAWRGWFYCLEFRKPR